MLYTVTFLNYDDSTLGTASVGEGETASYSGATPEKPSDAQYSYKFTGWDKELTNVTSSFSTKAQFSESTNTYTITWENYDGSVLETDENVAYGSAPKYDGLTPAKGESAQYSYAFTGWSPSVVSVDGDATYTAQFSESTNTYTVTWENYDGTVLETDTNVAYGSTPSYDGSTPTKAANKDYVYSFSDWSPEITSVAENVTYIARFAQTDNLLTINYSSNEYYVSDCDNSATSVIVPEIYDDGTNGIAPVTSISYQAFYDCASLATISLGSSITDIGYFAFLGTAFYNDSSNWDDGMLYLDSSDGSVRYLISASTDLTSVSIDDKTTVLAASAFGSCTSLSSVTISNSLTHIGYSAFSGCTSLTSIVLPDSVTFINSASFYNCTSLASITIKDSVTYIGYEVFKGTAFYNGSSNWDGGMLYLDSSDGSVRYLISASTDLTSVSIDEKTKVIAEEAFGDCASFSSVTIPDSVITIGVMAFKGCTSLVSIIIPDSVAYVGSSIFFSCSSLTSVYCEASEKPSRWNSKWNNGYDGSIYWYSETSNTDGSHWHYADGIPTLW